jgi:hypothetical protein
LPELDAASVVSAVRSEGVCVVGQLPEELLNSIRRVTDELPAGEYARFHEANRDVRELVNDEVVLSVLRTFFRAEPELLECTVVVHRAEDDALKPKNSQRYYHFDYAGWDSLNLFVYLSDVEGDSGAHEIVVGTHRRRRVRDAIRPWIPDEEIERRFEGRIRRITGPAGTMFFENTEAFHRRLRMKRRRVILNVLFASHRGLFSHGRLARPYAEYLEAQRRGAA